jgi:hypothetical protein
VFYSGADLKKPAEIRSLVSGAADALGGLHILWCACLLARGEGRLQWLIAVGGTRPSP